MQATSSTLALSTALPELAPSRGAFEKQLLELLPQLRAFALRLSGNPAESDDLVQETAIKALRAYRKFEMGTNMKAWTFTILRNHRLNEFRTRAAQMEELTDEVSAHNSIAPSQEGSLELSETLDAMGRLNSVHREVLTLVRILGHDYQYAAGVMDCPIGTIKSRLNRADIALKAMVEQGPAERVRG